MTQLFSAPFPHQQPLSGFLSCYSILTKSPTVWASSHWFALLLLFVTFSASYTHSDTNKSSVHKLLRKQRKVIRTLTILSEVPPLEMEVPLSPTREGRVWDIQLVTMAMVLSTAPIFSIGTLMVASCGGLVQTALEPALPCSGPRFQPTPLCSRELRQGSSRSASASVRTADTR